MSDAAVRLDAADLPDDAAALKAMLVAERGMRLDLAGEVTRLTAIVDAFKRAIFGRRSEKLDPGQLERKRCPRPLPVGGRGPLIQSPMFGDGLEASFAKKIAVLFGERWRARRTAGGDRGPDGPAALA